MLGFFFNKKISDTASHFNRLLRDNDVGDGFYDSVDVFFISFDERNQAGNNLFSNDVEYLVKSTVDDIAPILHPKRSSQRLDTYLYIYYRIERYANMIKKNDIILSELQKKIFELLASRFKSTNGREPEIHLKDRLPLQEMNIFQHLSSVTIESDQSLNTAFALFKLSIESSMSVHGHQNRLKWKDLIEKVRDIKISIDVFVKHYLDHKYVFQHFPLDVSGFICLIQRTRSLKSAKSLSCTTLSRLANDLKLNIIMFYKEFQPIFDKDIQIRQYQEQQISEFLLSLSQYDDLFLEYLTIYASNVMYENLWKVFLNLSRISIPNDTMKKHLTSILTKQIVKTTAQEFREYIASAKEHLRRIPQTYQSHFIEMFEQIYDEFMLHQIQQYRYTNPLSNRNFKELLNIDSSLIPNEHFTRPTNLKIIQQLLFRSDSTALNPIQKIQCLFENVEQFKANIGQNRNPNGIIADEWLEDILLPIPQVWIQLDRNIYKKLCNYQNNPWAVHIWSRIIQLSLSKKVQENVNSTLIKLNDWMKLVEHNVYQPNDNLTIVFVGYLFGMFISKYTKTIILLPNIETIISFAMSIKEYQPNYINKKQIEEFVERSRKELEQIFRLTHSYFVYRELLKGSIIRSFLPFIDLKTILTTIPVQLYKFPISTTRIDNILSIIRPVDIDIKYGNSKEEFFDKFIQEINNWLFWFDRFIEIFQPVIEWFKTYNVTRDSSLSLDLNAIRTDGNVIQLKKTIEEMLKILETINDLQRLCYLLNCLTSFRIIDQGTFNNRINITDYIKELERFQPTNTFTVEGRTTYEHRIPINDNNQNIYWSLTSIIHPCNIQIHYQTNDLNKELKLIYENTNVHIHRNVLCGQFETKQNGQLIITINNKQNPRTVTLWYRIRSINSSICQLFQGVVKMIYTRYYGTSYQAISRKDFNGIINETFRFIDDLLNGSLTLNQMANIEPVFRERNIHIREEVEKLLTSRSIEQPPHIHEIDQVCQWLQIYQYYTHISIIIECISKFDILSNDSNDESIGRLRRLGGDENCTLRDITQVYQVLQQRFQNLTNQHLQLIRTVVECSNVVSMMKEANLYSDQGRSRFQGLRDNLTTQFQLQEKNNMILNSWIITYTLIEPFINKVNQFDDFLQRIAQLPNLEETSLNHIKNVNDNIQIVKMWLSAEDTTVVDNALITMENLYKSGSVHIHLCHLMKEQSYFEIPYYIDRYQGVILNNDEQQQERIKLTLSMTDIEDHKRQLTFCHVDNQQNIFYSKKLIDSQLKLFQTIEKIFLILKKLELSGHPDYQLRNLDYDIHLQIGNTKLTNLRDTSTVRLEQIVKTRIDNLDESVHKKLENVYLNWINNLKKFRSECYLLKLFSNRQIMILIILLQQSTTTTRICFLKNLYSFQTLNNQINEEEIFAIHCLKHYLSSLRLQHSNDLINIYNKHRIDIGSNTEICLKKLINFLREYFHNENELMNKQGGIIDHSQQYLIKLNSIDNKDNYLNMDTICILLNIFNQHLPASYQILWCSTATIDDIELFFDRIRTFHYLIFVIMDIDKMNHRLREILFYQQDLLRRDQIEHGTVFYFSKEFTTSRHGLREFNLTSKYRNSNQTYTQFRTLLQRDRITLPDIQIIAGDAGIGKTHRINTQNNHDDHFTCFSINENLNLSLLISSFLDFDSKLKENIPIIYFNISICASFEQLNRTLFSLFICGSLIDVENGLIFTLPNEKIWKFIIEVPYSKTSELTIKENFNRILPLLSIISPTSFEEVNNGNYQLFIGEEEEIVARFLKAYRTNEIDRVMIADAKGIEHKVSFNKLTNPNECRELIYNCIDNYAFDLPRNKLMELSFTKFLYRRVRFFLGPFYSMNQTVVKLGSTAIKQMIDEAKSLTKITFQNNSDSFRAYLVYDRDFSLHLLHNDWNRVPLEVRKLFNNEDPIRSIYYEKKDYLVECLAWLLNISYDYFIEIINENKFILTENFAYKLFHIHERKLTKLPLIIEGETGVGKTFLLKFYSSLLNASYIKDPSQNSILPRIIENISQWLLNIIDTIIVNQPILLNSFVQHVKRKELGLDEDNNVNEQQQDPEFLNKIKLSLNDFKYNEIMLNFMWKTILTISNDNHLEITNDLTEQLRFYVTKELSSFPLIEPSHRLNDELAKTESVTIQVSIDIFEQYLTRYKIKPLFYRLLLHPGINEEQVAEFMFPIIQLARQLSTIELVVFFDEVNTSSCLGLFKEMFLDGTIHGREIPKNIFFTAAINPYRETTDDSDSTVFRSNFIVHKLPESLDNLIVSYGILESRTMGDYIHRKIQMFRINSSKNDGKSTVLDNFVQKTLADCILVAQEFCESRLARNSVSQREIQRCFNLIEFFWNMRYDNEITNEKFSSNTDPKRCIALSLALIYYFRLPTKEDNVQRNDHKTPSREELGEILSEMIPGFEDLVQTELENFVNTDNFVIPPGVAINQAIREHIFAIVVSLVTRTPLCIIGVPGQSKTLSFQIVVQNLQGSQLSPKQFCKRLPAIDPFYCLGSKYTRSEDIAYNFDRAIKREQHYQQNGIDIRCVVFLDEASLPDENKMVLKVLHPYLDDGKVAFVAIANKAFDAANANRMICIYRSLPSENEQKILAYGCLGLQMNYNKLDHIIYGLCQGYRRIRQSYDIFHDRDFIYMLRELRFELSNINENEELNIGEITPASLLRAIQDNFNGIKQDEFDKLTKIFFQSVEEQCPNFSRGINYHYRDIPTILRESMTLDSKRRRLYGRYKLVIDESEDESAVHLLFQSGILNPDPNQTTIFRMSDFPDDLDNELRNVEILSKIKLCMETGKTILMVNTGRIHGSLYDVFNQNFSIMATDDTRKIFSKVAIGPKTVDVVVHENFQCIVHIKRSEFNDIPAPFLSRFQKYALGVTDFYTILSKQLPINDQKFLDTVKTKVHSFIQHFGQQYFIGFNESTLDSCLLNLIKKDENQHYYLSNIHRSYSQLNSQSKSFIEYDSTNIHRSLLYLLISKLIQLVSPESMIYKLPTFNDSFARLLCENYFYQQEHFNINNFVERILSYSSYEIDNVRVLPKEEMTVTTKVMISTRTSTFVTGLNNESKVDLLNMHEKIDIINLGVIENSPALHDRFKKYKEDQEQQILLIIIDGRIVQQRLYIPFTRQLIDEYDKSCNIPNEIPRKFFIILIHSTKQEIDYRSSFPSIFLHDWDYYFLDTSTSGSGFHLQKMLQILTSSLNTTQNQRNYDTLDNNICDLNTLFDDCLWEFCSRMQINLQDLSIDRFQNHLVGEFYQQETNIRRRVECLKMILQQSQQLKQRIVSIYHENISANRESSDKTFQSIYQLSKDILSGKRSNYLVDSLQSKIRTTFTNFTCNILKFIVNDYGLETLYKLSDGDKTCQLLLNLIDYSSFIINDNTEDDSQSLSIIPTTFQLTNHYSYIPQTPLYHLLQQRIKILADEIKLKLQTNSSAINENDDMNENIYAPTTTMIYGREYDDHIQIEHTSKQFRNQLIETIMNDKILTDIISSSILQSYTTDTVRLCCAIVEKSFENNIDQCKKTIDFITRWLLLIDDNDDLTLLDITPNQPVWLLAHVYTYFEYDQNDLLSLYTICRIMDQLDSTQTFYDNLLENNQLTRSIVRENLFQIMFDYLWKNLSELCSSDKSIDQWIHSYTFISKYYPSDKVLQHMQQIRVKGHIEFMNLAYLIFLNENISQAKILINELLQNTNLLQDDIDGRMMNQFGGSICLKLLPTIINTIERYFHNENLNKSTVMIDIQQWIISTLKSSNQSCEFEIKELCKFLNQSTNQLTLSMKQFLFDELMNILFFQQRQNRPNLNKQKVDFWDRISLLPIISSCISNINIENYQLPSHPSIIIDNNQREILFDLFFFHLKRLAYEDSINSQLIHKILMSNIPNTNDKRLELIIEKIYTYFKDYFLIELTALFLCEKDLNNLEQQQINNSLNVVINKYLIVDSKSITLSSNVQHFLGRIITKRSWNYLLNLLKSERFQLLNAQWSNTIFNLIEIQHNTPRNKFLQFCHQFQFTLSINNNHSIFPEFHQIYDELSKIIDQCVKTNDQNERWKPFSDWIQLKLNVNQSIEIKVMLLLHIYYNYYCNNQLNLLNNLLNIIENFLQPLDEELRVFRALLQPEQYLIGYSKENNNNIDRNQLNNLFQLDYHDEDELVIRHELVNLLAMILLGGKQNFLWTFTFEPLKLLNTFGFGSTRPEVIKQNGVHYDCGCILTENGDLVHFPNSRGANQGALNTPSAYIAYFSTFGAMAWHMLLFTDSTTNLFGPILAQHAINDQEARFRLAGDSIRAKVCHFVRTRLLATYNFLSIQSNQDDACMLMNRCFEKMAQLTQPDNIWIKPIYTKFDEKFHAEEEYQTKIFYPINQTLAEYKNYINNLYLQSQIQKNLLDYVSQMPILIQFKHFKTELSNPECMKLPLKILRKILDSFDFLKITSLIYDLGRFYILLHQTYSQLIEQNQLTEITLRELYERGQKHQKNSTRFNYQQNQDNQYKIIIDKGIHAVNTYHSFADGLIQPGACDETQRFTIISFDTPVNYLLTTENYDEGDIIMRILSVLVDYHNSILDLFENGTNENNDVGQLKNLIDKLSRRNFSVAQIIQENTGVITLNEQDCSWIERLSRASLEIHDEYFPKLNTQLHFNFVYIQFYIIRSYLLVCRIDYRCIQQKYQYLIPQSKQNRIENKTINQSHYTLDDSKFIYLQEKRLGQLFYEYNLLRKLIEQFQRYQYDISHMNLQDYLQTIDDYNDILLQIIDCQFPDFELRYIDDVCQLYEQLINDFDYSILNTSVLLRIPFDDKQMNELNQILNINSINLNLQTNLQTIIRIITDFLNELKEIEDTLVEKSSLSLLYICQIYGFDSPMVTLIPESIKCENYILFVIRLVELRLEFQEKTIEKDETIEFKWNDDFTNEQIEIETINIFDENFRSRRNKIITRSPLEIPLNDEQIIQLDQFFINEFNQILYDENKDTLQISIGIISEFLNDLQHIEEKFQQELHSPLVNICQFESIENSLVNRIPIEIKCENYKQFMIRLMQMRSQLQDRYDELTDPRRFSIPFNQEQNFQMDQFLNHNILQSNPMKTLEQFQIIINNLNELHNELETIKDKIFQQLSLPLITICKQMSVKCSLAMIIPNEINCENYITFINRLIEKQTQIENDYDKLIRISVPFNDEQTIDFDRFLNENFIDIISEKSIEELQLIIQNINKFFHQLETIKDNIQENPLLSLKTIYEEQFVECTLGIEIPEMIKCENYNSFIDKFMKIEFKLKKYSKEILDSIQLNVNFNNEQNLILKEFFNNNFIQLSSQQTINELQMNIKTIDEYLNQLETIQDIIRNNLSSSIRTLCEEQNISTPNHLLIPNEIKCENYIPFINEFTRIRIQLEDECKRIIQLSVEFNEQQNILFNEFLNENFIEPSRKNHFDYLEILKQTIIEFINEIKTIENIFQQQLHQSLAMVCQNQSMKNSLITKIPQDIQCKNYFPFINKLIDMQLRLEELAVPLNDEQNLAIEQFFNENFIELSFKNDKEHLEENIQSIEEFFNKLKYIEDQLRQQRSQSLRNISKQILIQNSFIERIPNIIKCENYISLMIKLMELKSSIPKINETLFELKIQYLPLTISNLLNRIREKEEQLTRALSTISNLSRFAVIDHNGIRKAIAWRTDNIFQKVQTTFDEKGYKSQEFIIVNQDQIFVDVLNNGNDQISLRLSTEYQIIPRTSLNHLILEFNSNEKEYLVTSTCQLSSIITHSIINHQFISSSNNVLFGFFDELGSYIDEDKTIEEIYRSNYSNIVRIRIIKYENNTNFLSGVTLSVQGKVFEQKLFHPMTKLTQINLWLKTTDTIKESYSFCDREQKIILNEQQTISSSLSIIDGINNDDIMTVILSYEKNQQSIRILKSSLLNDLLIKEQYRKQLNVQIPANDCILVRKNIIDDEIISEEILRQPIRNYSIIDNEQIHFQIGVLIEICQYDRNRLISKPIFDRNITIKQLIEMITDKHQTYQYLASLNSHRILNSNEQLVNLIETKFHLLQEIETCSIIIHQSNDIQSNSNQQQYAIFATMADIYKQNEDIINNGYLVYDNRIALSHETSLTYFRSVKSPVVFVINGENCDANVTIIFNEVNSSFLKFHCSRSIEIQNLAHLACQLFHVNRKYYRLFAIDDTDLDDTMALYEFFESMDNIQVKLICIADFKCKIIYEDQTIIIPASKITTLSTVFDDTLKKFFIPIEDNNKYELRMFDSDELIEMDLSFTMEQIRTADPTETTFIQFQLMRKQSR